MHLRNRCLHRPSVSSPLDNRAHLMANTSQAPDLEGLHREIHGIAKQMRLMNENNACLIQLLATVNPPPPAAPPIHDIEQSHRSQSRSSRKTPRAEGEEVRRGRSPHRNDQFRHRNMSTSKKIQDLNARLDAINTRAGVPVSVDTLARNKRSNRDSKQTNERRPRTPPHRPELILPPLNAPIAQVLTEIKHEKFLKCPEKIKTDSRKRNRNKYCEFHRDHGHNTEDCFQLNEQIADLIKKGYLRKYVADRPPPDSPKRSSSKKRHARKSNTRADEEVYNLSSVVDIPPPITFSNDDLRGLHFLHNDPLVVSAVIAYFNVQRILIDNRSSADILFISAFERIKIGLDKLHHFCTPLVSFGGNMTHPLGWIKLPVTLGTGSHTRSQLARLHRSRLPFSLQRNLGSPNFRRN
ncbi:hypothetical protein Acr_00g0075160 [Actinidia rufa]|uniref:Reverse transcriptase domain-containing protein n=1 Tax=Actinidia rufa TaxID=165716 RepID=A0A7J0DSZ1_9ERIC|nr:hypothetical protein Acr_00g0075160 [Actinidia rufa]